MVIDTLQLDIVVNTKNSGASITTVRNSLEKLYKTLNDVKNQDFSKFNDDLAKLTGRLVPLATALNGLNSANKNLTSLGTRLQTFNKRMSEIDAKAMSRKFDLMTQAITPFIDKVSSAQEALIALNGVMNGAKTMTKTANATATPSTSKKVKSTNNAQNSLVKNLNFGSMIAKLYFIRNITKQLSQDIAKVVQYGIDYEETLNLWQVAMKDNIAQAREFISTMRSAYGISSSTLMNYQATFKNMLSALEGLNDEVAYGLSEALTGMALDYASLYNTSIESAMTKFQAVLSGQVRPIRSESGYDITESTIFALYQELGGTKSVRQLDQLEKRLLRILAVYKQMQGVATGDLSKTITSSANQIRIMGEQGKEFATWIGVAFNTMLEKSGTLIEVNAWLYSLSAIAKQFAISMGYVEKDYSIADPIQEANTELDIANKSVDELKGKLLGFDKFQVLSTANIEPSDVDLANEITKAIQEYERIVKDADNPAFERSLEILQGIGLELDENGNIVGGFEDVAENVKVIQEVLESAKDSLSTVAGIALDLFEKGSPFLDILLGHVLMIDENIISLADIFWNEIMPFLEPAAEIVGSLQQQTQSILSLLFPIISIVAQVLQILKPILDLVNMISKASSTLANSGIKEVGEALTPVLMLFEAILKVVLTISEVWKSIFTFDWKSLTDRIKGVWSDWRVGNYMQAVNAIDNPALLNNNDTTMPKTKSTVVKSTASVESAIERGMIRGTMATSGSQSERQIIVNVGSKTLFEIFVDEARSNGYELVKVR